MGGPRQRLAYKYDLRKDKIKVSDLITGQPGIEKVKEKKKRKKKKRAKFLKFEDDNFSSEVSFKVNVIRDVRTSGGSCQELTLWWSGLR